MNFSKAFGCGRITPSVEDGTAEETFMKGLEAVQRHGDSVDWKEVAKYYSRAASEVSAGVDFLLSLPPRRVESLNFSPLPSFLPPSWLLSVRDC